MTTDLSARSRLLVCTAMAAASILPFQAMADPAPASAPNNAPASAYEPAAGDIIVTARRSQEKLQDVPESVQAISGSELQKLSITSADEVSKLAPGLTLHQGGSTGTEVTLRGVTWKPGSGTPATPIYFNEVPFDPGNTIESLFDIGDIEVLKGPQGTTRGAPSISGAVTITTKKPDLEQFGGFAQGQYGEAHHWDIQAGLNIPIIKDVLALRLATNIEDSEGNRVFSVHSTIKPKDNDRSYRATLLFKPTDTLSIEAMYQRRTTNLLGYGQVVGTGSPGAPASPLAFFGGLGAIPANFNGPPLTEAQRASVQAAPAIENDHVDLLTINASWEFHNQLLTYNYGRQWNFTGPEYNPTDVLNMVPGFEPYLINSNPVVAGWHTHEIRLSSERSEDRPFDYDIGWFSKHSGGPLNFAQPVYFAGAFGGPNSLPGAVTTPNPAYVLNSNTALNIGQVFDSFYGDVKFHIDHNTELTGGLAIIRDRVPVSLNVTTFAALTNVAPLAVVKLSIPAPFRPFFPTCESISASLITSASYPGVCDAAIPAGVGNATQNNNDVYSRAIYNFSLSHHFSDDVLAYATTGSSYRSGLPAIGNPGLPSSVLTPPPETAKSYEVGVKTNWGRHFLVNAAVFQIDYKNQLTQFANIPYYNATSNKTSATLGAFYRPVNSRVRGAELEVAAQPTPNLALGANLSYAQIKSTGSIVPAQVGQCAAAGPLTPTNVIDFCPSAKGQVLNQESPFQATANGSYTLPLGPLDGYVRFNLSYKGRNPNYGNILDASGNYKATPAYAVLDLFAGIAGKAGAWNLGVYAKNVTNKQVELSSYMPLNNSYGPYAVAPGGYVAVNVSPPREVGVTLRYAFGSR